MAECFAIRGNARAHYSEARTREDTDMTSKLARTFLVLLLVIPIVRAQSASPETSLTEQKKARAEREKKTLALVDEIIKGTQSLKLPENRIRIGVALAGSLWPRDEKRARALFKDAVASLGEITAAADSGEEETSYLAQLSQQLRQEILQVAANHDPKLAREFLRASRPTSTEQRFYGQPSFEAQLEMRMAGQIAAKDPQEALSLAEDSLKLAIDYEAINFLYNLQSQNKAVAERFLGDIMNHLRTDDISKNPASYNISVMLLRTWIENNRRSPDQPVQRTTPNLSLSNLDEQTARELSNILINAVLNNPESSSSVAVGSLIIDGGRSFRSYPGQTAEILQQLKPLLPDIERLSPNQIPPLRARIAEIDRLNQAQQGPWAKYQELAQNGTASELIEASKTAPPEVANNLVQQAAWKAFNQGDANSARAMVEKIDDPRQRRQMELNLDRQSFSRASEQEKIAEARALISRLPVEERAGLLCQLAASAAAKGDKATALQLLVEAQGLAGDRALSYQQLGAQLQIARTYEQLDFTKTSAIVDTAIDQINELAAAASVLNGFDLQYFRSGEFVNSSGNSLSTMALEFSRELGSIASNDFDRARSMADRFQLPEMRLMALLQIVQLGLSADGQ